MNQLANLALFAPLLLALFACIFAVVTGSTMRKDAKAFVHRVDELAGRATQLLQDVAKLPKIQLIQPAIQLAEEAEPAPPEPPSMEPVKLSPFEQEVESRFSWLGEFDSALKRLSASSKLSADDLTSGAWQRAAIEDSLDRAHNEEELALVDQELNRVTVEIARVVLSKCDHDIDPERINPQLQPAIEALVKLVGLDLYVPGTSDPVDTKRHISVGVEAHPRDDLRGTVASVRARGLIRVTGAREELIAPAEILVYD